MISPGVPHVIASPATLLEEVILSLGNWFTKKYIDLGQDGFIVFALVFSAFINVYVASAVALLTVIHVLTTEEKRRVLLETPHLAWLAPFLLLLVTVPLLNENWASLGLGLAITGFFVIYLYFSNVMNRIIFEQALDLACLLSLVCAVVAVAYKLSSSEDFVRSMATFQNANYYGYAIELVLFIAIHRLSTAKSKGQRRFYYATLFLNIAALWATDCRSAWLSVLAGLAVFFLLQRQWKALIALLSSYALLIAAVFTLPVLFPRMGYLDMSMDTRVDIWLSAWRGFLQHPLFGTGPLTYYAISGGKYMHAHNMYLETLLTTGFVGMLSLGAYFFHLVRDAVRQYRAGRQRGTLALLFAICAATMVHGLLDFTALWPQTGILLCCLLASTGLMRRPASLRLVYSRGQEKPVSKSA